MIIDVKIRDQKFQHDINGEAAKISALPSEKIIEQDKFAYLPLWKAFEKQTKTIAYQRKKQIKSLEEHGSNYKIKSN